MILYIMRHAEAVERSETLPEEWRYLTGKGRLAAEQMSSAIAGSGPKPRLILTSPLLRAVQTAEIQAAKACRKKELIVSALLSPGADMDELIACLTERKGAKRVMVVGHEPQLGALVTALLGRADGSITLKKGACVALELSSGRKPESSFLWYMTPGGKRISSFKKAFPQKVR
ncbi:MAG: phosphohistidine phosphatase SixA [Deltaproteobacteria bacterium]|nr:phosphohistidine phosphatase SixA [Deltaproteobacteria bacterium]